MEEKSELQERINSLAGKRHLPSWREMNWDTSPAAEAVLFKLWRETPAWRKLEMLEGLNRMARQLAVMGLRKRFPDASPEELKRRFATIVLGEDLANAFTVQYLANEGGQYDRFRGPPSHIDYNQPPR